ncbi:MAG: hypothetical protein KAJ58_00540 [Candidatus Pacebacteria bacterium]|nr:hypothetical protein [Candidatus Paceibacterota bacterium]
MAENIYYHESRETRGSWAAIAPGVMIAIILGGFLYWSLVGWVQLPTVKWSTKEDCPVAVYSCMGEKLPLTPLPDKYEVVYVK